MIETICSKCGNIRVFEDSYAGRKFKCPECGSVVEIKPTKIDDVATMDEASNESVEGLVTKKRQELSDAESMISEKETKKQQQREKEDAIIERELKVRLENAVKLAKKERVLAYTIPLLYLLDVVWFFGFADFNDDAPFNLFKFIGVIFFFIGWISVLRRVTKYTDHKKEWFGDKNGYVFTETCIEATRRNIIRELYPKRYEEDQAKADMEFKNSINQVQKILYELEHPEEKQSYINRE